MVTGQLVRDDSEVVAWLKPVTAQDAWYVALKAALRVGAPIVVTIEDGIIYFNHRIAEVK